jgi:hypothetical protein
MNEGRKLLYASRKKDECVFSSLDAELKQHLRTLQIEIEK